MADPDRTGRVLQQFRDAGLKIAIDDFGKALSSIRRLKDLPVDILKVDQSFVRKLPGDSDAATMARAIIQLGHSLGMVPLAEGIDSEEQREFLVAESCPLGQGYLFAKPMAAEDITSWVAEDHRVPEEPQPTPEEREESVRALRQRISGGEDGGGSEGPDGRDGGRSGGDDQTPWAVARAGGEEGTEISARSGPVGTAVVERPHAGTTMPPGDDDNNSTVEWSPGDDGAGDEPVDQDDWSRDEAARRRRRGGGPAIGH